MPDHYLSRGLFIPSFAEVAHALTHKQRIEEMDRFLDAFLSPDTSNRLLQVAVPTLVLAGGAAQPAARSSLSPAAG